MHKYNKPWETNHKGHRSAYKRMRGSAHQEYIPSGALQEDLTPR